MPIYEYRCEPCEHTFETLVRSSTDVPRCPKCGTDHLHKEFSVPSAPQGGARGSSSLPICNAPAPSSFGGGCGAGGCGGGMCAM